MKKPQRLLQLCITSMTAGLLLCATRNAQAEEYLTFLLGGQSNMVGFSSIDGYSKNGFTDPGIPIGSDLLGEQTDVRFFDGYVNHNRDMGTSNTDPLTGSGSWTNLQPGDSTSYLNSNRKTFGPELSFGRDIAAAFPDRKIALIKYAHGATSLARTT